MTSGMTLPASFCARAATLSSCRRRSITATSSRPCGTLTCSTATLRRRWNAPPSPGIAPEAGRFESSSHWQDNNDFGHADQSEELVGQLERALLRAGRRLAREQRERVGEVGAGETEDGHERGRQRAAIVEERVERVGDVALVAVEPSRSEIPRPAECGDDVQGRVACGVAQRGGEAGGQVGGGEGVEGAAASARGREDRIPA